MSREDPPWQCPAAGCADGGGSIFHGVFGKPLETMGRKARGCGVRQHSMLVRLHGEKPWQTGGNPGTQSQRLRHNLCYARSATGYFASDFAKKGC